MATRFFLDIFARFIHKKRSRLIFFNLVKPGETALITRSLYWVSDQEGVVHTDNRNPSIKQAIPYPGSNRVVDTFLFFKQS